MKLGTILVPLDGSALAEAALPKALELAEVSGARLLLLRAAQAQSLPGVDPTEAQVRVVSEAEAYLAEIQKRLSPAGSRQGRDSGLVRARRPCDRGGGPDHVRSTRS